LTGTTGSLPYFDLDASRKNPDGIVTNARRQFGKMILSKTPILSTRLFPLPKTIITKQRNMVMGMLGVDDLAHRWWEGKDRDHLLPDPPPAWGD